VITNLDTTALLGQIRQSRERGGIAFVQSVGVAPGTSTLCVGCAQGLGLAPAQGGDGDEGLLGGYCVPGASYRYMTQGSGASAPRRAAPARPGALVVYGSEVELKGPPFGGSWASFGAIVGGGLLAVAGVAILRRR